MRWLLGRGHRGRAACASTRRSPRTSSTRPTRATRSRDLLARYTPFQLRRRRRRRAGQLDFGGGADERADRRPRGAGRRHLAERAGGIARQAGHGRAVPHDREPARRRCWRRWSTSASPSTSPSCAALNRQLTAEVERLGAELQRVVGRPFNLNSPMQLREILYTERGLAPGKKTKTGFSTDAATLEKMRDQWPEFIDPLLQYREVEKLRGTYGTGLLAEVARRRSHPRDVQPDRGAHRPAVAATSRTCTTSRCAARRAASSARRSSPRRAARCSSPTTTRSSCAASPTSPQDPGLIEAFTTGTDIHNATAARVFGVEPTAVTLEQRSKAKMVQLRPGLRDGGVRPRPAAGIPTDEASVILDAYFVAFPNVKAYMERTVDRGAHARLHRDAVRSPPADPRAVATATSASARPASARR